MTTPDRQPPDDTELDDGLPEYPTHEGPVPPDEGDPGPTAVNP